MWLSGGTFRNKSPDSQECIMCSRKSKNQCCCKVKVVKDEVRASGGMGSVGSPIKHSFKGYSRGSQFCSMRSHDKILSKSDRRPVRRLLQQSR